MSAYSCRTCGRVFNDQLDIIQIFSAAGKKDNVAAKILYTLTIMITEEDPTSKYICKMCYGHIDFFTRFSNTSRVHNNILMNNYIKEPSNITYKHEMTRFLSAPIEFLCYKQNSDIRGIHESFVNYIRSPVLNEINVSQLKGPISQNSNKSTNIIQTDTSNKSDNLLSSNQNEKENNNNSMKNIQPSPSERTNLIQPCNVVIDENSICSIRQASAAKPCNSDKSNHPKNIDEIICLDDDDGEDDNDVQVIENVANVISNNAHKKRKPRLVLKNKKMFSKNVIANPNSIALKHLMQLKKRLENAKKNSSLPRIDLMTPPRNQQSPITEQMIITPDITIPAIINTSPCDSSNHVFFPAQTIKNYNTTASTVSPETGFHFLFRSDQTVDLTSSENTPENNRRREVMKNQGKVTKKSLTPMVFTQKIITRPSQPLTNKITTKTTANVSRPKRTQTSTTSESKKIKKPSESNNTANPSTSISLTKLDLRLYQCPICEKYFCSTKSRQLHENECHILPPTLPEKSDKSEITSGDKTSSASQQEFLTYLNLVKRVSTNLPEHYANREHFQNALKIYGNVPGKYKCHYCKYETSRLYILWAHMCVNHIQLDSDVRSNTFCFVCNKTFGKRMKLLKHLDRCVESHLEIESSNNPSDEKITCDYSDSEINSLPELEEKLWSLVNV